MEEIKLDTQKRIEEAAKENENSNEQLPDIKSSV